VHTTVRHLTSTFEAFLQDADRAFQKAEDAKRRKRASTARAGEVRASDDRFVESLVLHMYRMHGATAQEATPRSSSPEYRHDAARAWRTRTAKAVGTAEALSGWACAPGPRRPQAQRPPSCEACRSHSVRA